MQKSKSCSEIYLIIILSILVMSNITLITLVHYTILFFSELDFERLRNRRRMHHERSVSPVEVHNGDSEQGEASNLSTPPHSISEQMCQDQDFPQKCSFLNSFQLSVVDRNKKKGKLWSINSDIPHLNFNHKFSEKVF